MKNKLAIIFVFVILIVVVLGCSSINPFAGKSSNKPSGSQQNSNQTLTDKALDTTVPDAIVGIPECDEVMKMLTEATNDPDDNFAEKAAKRIFANKIKDGIKRTIDENKGDKAEIAKTCKAFKLQIQKFKEMESEK